MVGQRGSTSTYNCRRAREEEEEMTPPEFICVFHLPPPPLPLPLPPEQLSKAARRGGGREGKVEREGREGGGGRRRGRGWPSQELHARSACLVLARTPCSVEVDGWILEDSGVFFFTTTTVVGTKGSPPK